MNPSQSFHSAEGIILRVIPFRDYDQIFVIFTAHMGLLKVLYKGSCRKRRGGQGVGVPLTKVEVIYQEKKGEIFSCQEMNQIDSFSSLRKEYLFLEVACDLLDVIFVSQWVGKPAPQLYTLLALYLKRIPQTVNPWILAASFRLKLLRHDGFISFPFLCSECGQELENSAFTRDDGCWCFDHQPIGSLSWNATELQTLYLLAFSQSYQEICMAELSLHLQNKIAVFFDLCIKR